MKEKIKKFQKEDWWLFCDNYLNIAQLACREMIEQKYKMFWNEEKGDIGSVEYWPHDLYIAAIYNLKHSIEIFLKYFLIVIEDKFPDIGKDGHNIEKYLALFKSKYNIKLVNKIIKKAYKDKKITRYAIESANREAEFSEEWMENIAKISIKYFNCEDIKKKIITFDLKDTSNDGFRYPKNKLTIELNYKEIVNEITKKDVKEVLKDIGELDNAFGALRFLIEVYHDVKYL